MNEFVSTNSEAMKLMGDYCWIVMEEINEKSEEFELDFKDYHSPMMLVNYWANNLKIHELVKKCMNYLSLDPNNIVKDEVSKIINEFEIYLKLNEILKSAIG